MIKFEITVEEDAPRGSLVEAKVSSAAHPPTVMLNIDMIVET